MPPANSYIYIYICIFIYVYTSMPRAPSGTVSSSFYFFGGGNPVAAPQVCAAWWLPSVFSLEVNAYARWRDFEHIVSDCYPVVSDRCRALCRACISWGLMRSMFRHWCPPHSQLVFSQAYHFLTLHFLPLFRCVWLRYVQIISSFALGHRCVCLFGSTAPLWNP